MIDALAYFVTAVDVLWSNGIERMQYGRVLCNCFFNAQPNGAT